MLLKKEKRRLLKLLKIEILKYLKNKIYITIKPSYNMFEEEILNHCDDRKGKMESS